MPRFPHHKNFVYKCYRFFEVKNLLDFLTIDGYSQVFRKLYMNWKTKSAVPRLMLMDPTTACNLSCKGCWANDYEKNIHLSYEKMDEILSDAGRLGISQFIFSGGEPMMRRKEVLQLVKKHHRISFGMFTNGTLIDDAFAAEMAQLGNLNAFISIEGFREDTDMRRGDGVYDQVIRAMDILKRHQIGFGFSVCYHAGNYRTIASDRFLDFMREKGAWIGWLFNYMPIGKGADLSLCCSAEQRAYVMEKIRDYRERHGFLIIDFANSGHNSVGCVAAGTDYAHINANGDLEPCAFCHYSDVNLNDVPLEEALRSGFFRRFRSSKPFSGNYLRSCPLIDVPDAIEQLTRDSSVRSTHLAHPESGEELARKTRTGALQWEPVANQLWEHMPQAEKQRFGLLTRFLRWGHQAKDHARKPDHSQSN